MLPRRSAASTPNCAAAAATAATGLGFFSRFRFFFDCRGLSFDFAQRLSALVTRLDVALALDARLFDMLGCGQLRRRGVALPGGVNHDALKLGFFIKEIRDVKKGVTFETDVHKRRLHARQHAHHAALVKVADDALILSATFDVELRNALVLHDRDFLFATIQTNN